MTDSIQNSDLGTSHEDEASILKNKKKKNLKIIIIGIGSFVLCSIICVGIIIVGLVKIGLEKAPIEAVLDAYMQDIISGDIEGAFALFSPRAQNQMNISDIDELTNGNNYILFEGYKQLTIQNINISLTASTSQNKPQGTVAKVDGIIIYEGGFNGKFNAVLENVDDKWRIFGISITVPPEKFPTNLDN